MRRKLETSFTLGRAARRRAVLAAALGWAAASTACLPYPVGTTAQPVPVGEARASSSLYMIPNALSLRALGDSAPKAPPAPVEGVDLEYRVGVDSLSDIAVRLPSMQGIVIDYKRRMNGPVDSMAAGVAMQFGAGVVNLGQHAFGDLAVIASGRDVNGAVAYGGLRIMGVVPLVRDAVSDQPTAGGFAGVRLTFGTLTIAPELGVYHDHSALGMRRGDLLLVPSVTFAARRPPFVPRFHDRGRAPSAGVVPPTTAIPVPVGSRPTPPVIAPPRRPPHEPSAAGPVSTPSGARPIPPPITPRATGAASSRPASRPARP